ncbi:uncharacterized protein BXZ73DRAFT_43928 [Epithele typhae]|uniref:uncharacterized protein n=1 Tax=Epithele typhae TaxID=378194 RepID=UPI00200732FF|nr:uncharacterized protein BXZ73DRAFT_43928 [Epithele typhae]KAH9939234.1 hypothetical protein BXZ73DRAFT_43928 [Epithele typhae]
MDPPPSDVDMPPADVPDPPDDSDDSDDESDRTASPAPSPPPAHSLSPASAARPPSAEPPPTSDTHDASSPSSSDAPTAPDSGRGRKSKPSSSNVPVAGPSAKPKSAKSAPPRASPSPPPPPARQPLQTIRLEIRLGGQEDYEVNIADLAKTTGQRPGTPVPEEVKRDSSDDSEGDDEAPPEVVQAGEQKVKRRRRVTLADGVRLQRNHASEYYDTADPFIDDSELAQDERTFFAQTKQKGFYVSSGQVALLNKPVVGKKPRSRKVNILAPSASVSAALSTVHVTLPALSGAGPSNGSISAPVKSEDGSRDAPIALLSDAEDGSKIKRKHSADSSNTVSISEGGAKKRRKTVEIQPFHPELEKAIEVLKEAIAKESWDVKGKFPPGLKPLLGQVALKAVVLGQYDENFFNLMPRLFPYNKFTMTKLIKRTVWRDHTNLLTDRQNALIEDLRVLASAGFAKAKEEWERSVMMWERRQERAKGEGGADGAPAGPGAGHSHEGSPAASDHTPSMGPTPLEARTSMDDGADHDDGAGGGGGRGNKDAHPPAQRYRLTDQMKGIIWQLVCLSNECCRIENEKNTLEGSNAIVSDQGVRKNLYQKIVAAFPDGWLSSGQISREVSVMKKKYEKESMEAE